MLELISTSYIHWCVNGLFSGERANIVGGANFPVSNA